MDNLVKRIRSSLSTGLISGLSIGIKRCVAFCLVFELAFPLALFHPLMAPPAFAGTEEESEKRATQSRDAEYEETLNSLQETLEAKRVRHPLDIWRLLDQETFALDQPQRVQNGKLQFVIVSPQGASRTLSESEANTAIQTETGSTLEIRFRGETVSRFRAPVAALAWVGGRYLVFAETVAPELQQQVEGQAAWNQELSFIDIKKYRDRAGLGENGLFPVFKFYRKLEGVSEGRSDAAQAHALPQLDLRGGVLHVSGHAIPEGALEIYSDAEEVMFNSSVNLSQPSFYEKAARTISDLGVFFDEFLKSTGEQLEAQGASTQEIQVLFQKRHQQLQAQSDGAPEVFKTRANTLEQHTKKERALAPFKPSFFDSIFNPTANRIKEIKSLGVADQFASTPTTVDEEIVTRLQGVAAADAAHKKKQSGFFNRVRLFLAKLSLPEPEGPSRLREALAYVSSGASRKSGGYAKAAKALMSRDALVDLAKSPLFKLGAGVGSAFLAGAVFPEETGQFLYQSLDISRTVFDIALHRWEMGKEVAGVAAHGTFGWMKDPAILSNAYLTGGKLQNLGVGLAAITTALYLALGVPHVTVNAIKLARDFKRTGVWREFLAWLQVGFDSGARGYRSALKMLASAFVSRQMEEQRIYLQVQTDAAAAAQGVADAKGSEFTPEQNAQVDTVLAKTRAAEQGFWERPLERLRQTTFYQRFFKKTEKQQMSFGGAVMHFFFSLASFTNAGYAYTHIWQSWFGLRTMTISPTQLITNLIFPQYSKVVAGTGAGLHPPSEYNGGFTPRLNGLLRRLQGQNFADDLIAKWEEAILPLEAKIHKAAVHESFLAVSREFGGQRKTLTELFSRSGIQSVDDKALSALSSEAKLFFRFHYEKLFETSMREFVSDLLAQASPDPKRDRISRAIRAATGSLEQIKVETVDVLPQSRWLALSDEEIAAEMRVRASDPRLLGRVRQETRSGFLSFGALQVALKHRNLRVYDPKNNGQIRRMRAVERQKNNPRAMGRAVRSMIASNIVDKPMELGFAFLFLAGVVDPLIKPLQDEMFSDTSTFFLSKYEFWNGFVSSVITGALADVWVKLQQDEKNEGSFDQVPEGDEKKLTFLQYYWRKFNEPDNSIWKNQKHYFELIIPNILPALPTFLVTNLLTLGRFDFDMWFMGYFMTTVIWNSGLAMKIEQAFELSTGWYAKDIPTELLHHPKVQQYLAVRTGKARIWFNVFNKISENLQGYFWSTLATVGAPLGGTRALTRLIMPYGHTPTEWFAAAAAELRGSSWAPEPLVRAVDQCVGLLTNKYQGLLDPRTGEVFTKEQLPVGDASDRK